ncbi:MAG: hypothetical protein JST26_09310 [Bacteroidetes bacterium]|nr:hypothetical protein [Bacteroidota bacterium]
MYKQHLLENIEREIVLLKQIAPLIEERDLAFRPYEKARSTEELMQYLSGLGAVMLRWMIKNDLTPEAWEKIRAYRKTMTIATFPERLDEQLEQVRAYMNEITEEDLLTKEVALPSKEKMILGKAIINAPIKWMAAYRLQLFVNLKMNGRDAIGTREAWTVLEAEQV